MGSRAGLVVGHAAVVEFASVRADIMVDGWSERVGRMVVGEVERLDGGDGVG